MLFLSGRDSLNLSVVDANNRAILYHHELSAEFCDKFVLMVQVKLEVLFERCGSHKTPHSIHQAGEVKKFLRVLL
jgi:hypothetical protein